MPDGKHRTLIVVAGMHRSGTSAYTGAIEGLGVTLGRNLAEGQAGINEKGYKEDEDLIDLHEDLLWSLSSAWDDIFALDLEALDEAVARGAKTRIRQILQDYFAISDCCGLKDPRLCLFLPLWLEVCRDEGIDVRFILPFRDPHAVARSLEKRDGMLADRALVLWSKYLLAAEHHSRGYARVFLSYERLVSDPQEAMATLLDRLDPPLPGERAALAAKGASFITPELNRSARSAGRETPIRFAVELQALLQDVDGGDADSGTQDRLDDIQKAYQDYLAQCDPVLVDQVKAFRHHAVTYRQYWRDALNSRSVRWGHAVKTLLRR